MAKPRTNLIIEERAPNLLRVWTPAPAKARGRIEAIEGVIEVFHSTMNGHLNVWLNPCYSKAEIGVEIAAALSEKQQDRAPSRWERFRMGQRRTVHPRRTEKTIAEMCVGEVGYIVSQAIGSWSGSGTLGGLNLGYRVHAREFGTGDTSICRTKTGWVVGGKVFTEPKTKERFQPRPPNMPYWAEPRLPDWKYMGWIKRPPAISTFEDLVANACESDHGEIRGVDVYPEGATCWMKE